MFYSELNYFHVYINLEVVDSNSTESNTQYFTILHEYIIDTSED